VARPVLEVADILNRHGDAFLAYQRPSRGQMKVMGAIRACRTAALGGHVACCEGCDHVQIAYNSCRNRHCPKCQGQVARAWLEDRQADLLPVPYYHVVFTLPARIAAIAFGNKAVVYDLLFRTAADTAEHSLSISQTVHQAVKHRISRLAPSSAASRTARSTRPSCVWSELSSTCHLMPTGPDKPADVLGRATKTARLGLIIGEMFAILVAKTHDGKEVQLPFSLTALEQLRDLCGKAVVALEAQDGDTLQ
jgi:hypothetical protein